MKIKIGEKISTLRKSRGMTQEQLASLVGVSTPAVSKWETDTSYPDITLLCPIARALGTNVDCLLSFEKELSMEEISSMIEDISQTANRNSLQSACDQLFNYLYDYPSNMILKYEAAMLLQHFIQSLLDLDCKQIKQCKELRDSLLFEVRKKGELSMAQAATILSISFAIDEDKFECAEEMMCTLPSSTININSLWAKIHLKRGETQCAKEILQFEIFNELQCLGKDILRFLDEEFALSNEGAIKICHIYEKLAKAMEAETFYFDLRPIGIYLRTNKKEEALEYLQHCANAFIKNLNENILFTEIRDNDGNCQNFRQATCREILKQLSSEEFSSIQKDSRFKQALLLIKDGLK